MSLARSSRNPGIVLLLSLLVLSITSPADAGYSFTPLGDLPGGAFSSRASAVSADGSVVVGQSVTSANGNDRSFRWTSATGMVSLGLISESDDRSGASDISNDGEVIVGSSGTAFESRAFRWTAGEGMVPLPGNNRTVASATSADGSVIVGTDRWTPGASTPLAGFIAYGISADGRVVVGEAPGVEPGVFSSIAVRWTEANGFQDIGDLPGGEPAAIAIDVSSDGNVIVGQSYGQDGFEAFRWTAEDGMVGLGLLAGGTLSSGANAVSDDGNIAVGTSHSANGQRAFVWNVSEGMLDLQELLEQHGADLDGWQLSSANGISADGRFIVGSGINPQGHAEAWLATIAVPEPSTFILAAMGCSGLLVVMRRRK